MQAIILLGGQGTRLRALYPDRPKALVPVAGRPFIEWQIDWLQRGGVTHFHLAAGHMADAIEAWAAQQDLSITVTREPEPLGTGGAVAYVRPHLQPGAFWVVNGDTLLPNLDFQRLENEAKTFPTIGKNSAKVSNDWKNEQKVFQRLEKTAQKFPTIGKTSQNFSNDWTVTLAVTRIEAAGRFGTVEFVEDGRITAFLEKADRQAGWINGGVYRIEPDALGLVPAGHAYSLETELFPQLVADGRLRAARVDPPLLDMGTPEGLTEMERWLTQT